MECQLQGTDDSLYLIFPDRVEMMGPEINALRVLSSNDGATVTNLKNVFSRSR